MITVASEKDLGRMSLLLQDLLLNKMSKGQVRKYVYLTATFKLSHFGTAFDCVPCNLKSQKRRSSDRVAEREGRRVCGREEGQEEGKKEGRRGVLRCGC